MFGDFDSVRRGLNNPKINTPDMSGIKPMSQAMLEAIEPLKDELVAVKSELIAANGRAEKAEQRALAAEVKAEKAERRAHWLTLVSVLLTAFSAVYPVYVNWQQDLAQKQQASERAKMQSSYDRLAETVRLLRIDLDKARTAIQPPLRPLKSTERNSNKK